MIRNFYKFSTIIILLVTTLLSYGQGTITGVVTDSKTGDGLIGVNIIVPGTTYGTTTDIDGKYSIKLSEEQNQLECSYIGYKTQTVNLADYPSNQINIILEEGSILDEVVVIGYGTAKRRDVAGAVASLGAKDFNAGLIASPEQLIQGKFAGVQIGSNSGEPGGGMNVRIRGTSSIRNGNGPLYVVDGIPLDGGQISAAGKNGLFGTSSARNPLNFLAPNNIQSVDILKDPSTTAIYGSRGANGVVLITTKKGQFNQGVNYTFDIGLSGISKKYNILTGEEYRAAEGANILTPNSNVDWQDEIFQTGLATNHTLSFGGGDAESDYRISLSLSDQNGIVKESGFQRIAANITGSKKFLDGRLKIGAGVDVASLKDEYALITDNAGFEGDLLAAALKSNPTANIYIPDSLDEAGNKIPQQLSLSEPNPVAILQYTEDLGSTLRVLARVTADLTITDGLVWRNIMGLDRSQSKRNAAFSSDLLFQGIENKGRLYISDLERNNSLWTSYLDFNKEFNSFDLGLLAGYEYQKFDRYDSFFLISNFTTGNLNTMVNNFSNGNLAVPINSSNPIDELQSFFTRVKIGLKDRLYINASFRADGSSKFGKNNRYGLFPSISAKYIAIEDAGIFDNLSIRAGYGSTGNQEILSNLHTQRDRYNDTELADGINATPEGNGQQSVSFENADLRWESTVQIGGGIDFSLLGYKLTGSLDLYRKNTNDLLLKVEAAQPSPRPFNWVNVDGDVINQGVELQLDYLAVDNGKFSWDVGAVFGYNSNEVKNLASSINTGEINGQGLTGAFAQRIDNGQPLYAFFLREFDGYDESGVTKYKDGDVQRFTGASPLPKVNAGLTNSIRFSNLDFNFFLNGLFGHYIYSNDENAYFTKGSFNNGRNVTTDVIDSDEGPLNAPDVSTRFLYKGDFVRLQSASLGYSIPVSSNYVSDIRLFVNGQNLFTITGYPFQDPEVNVNKAIDDIPSFGIDYTAYPRARSILFGASINFK